MKVPATVFALCLAAGTAQAQSTIDQMCGQGHVNEIAKLGDVTENPDGYYVRDLQVQLSHGDPRIIRTIGQAFHLCTRGAATPNMESSAALLLMNERRVKFLFVPVG
jgi:hypothetical protein